MMKLIKFGMAALVVAMVSGCQTLPPPEEMPDSFYTNIGSDYYLLPREHKEEFHKRRYKRQRNLSREAACVFGTSPIIDREKLKCEDVVGSPEWEAIHKN